MKRKLNEEIKISFLKRLTGRENPSIIRIIASIIVAVLLFLLTFFAGFYLNQYMIKPSANVVFHPYVEDNSYLPIIITNGPKPLTDVRLEVKTCHMKNFKVFQIPDLIENQEYPIHLRDEETIYALNKILKHNDFRCSPLNTSPNTQCFIKTYIVNGKIYAPAQNCKKYRCGYCSYKLNLKSKQFSKNFTGFFFSPIEIKTFTLHIEPNDPLNISENETMFPYSPIGISLFSPYDICMFKTKNDYGQCKHLPIVPIINGTLTMEISPVNKSLGNLSINITQIR